MKKISRALLLAASLVAAACQPEPAVTGVGSLAGSCSDFNPDLNLYWGDLHSHTSYSMDAYAFGTTTTPLEAFEFAKGERLQYMPDGTPVKLDRPLDFAAVTDHAETFGVMHICTEGHHANQSEYCQTLRALSGTNSKDSLKAFREFLLPVIAGETPKPAILCEREDLDCEMAALDRWKKVQSIANKADAPCDFSAFIGYEWSATPGASHWHRNLVFKGTSVTERLVDYVNYPTPERMWAELERQCQPEDGCEVLAIPHNTNLSEGGGFDVEKADWADLRRRSRFERLIEISQSKGTSECLNENWDDVDSDCGFETYLLPQTHKALDANPSVRATLNRSFARNILSRGLQQYKDSKGELNSLQLGFVGSTDGHTSTPGLVEEALWRGDAWGAGAEFRSRWLSRLDYNPGSLVAVWSDQNTRDSIFNSLSNRRAYATSGTRISLRFSAQPAADKALSCEAKVRSGVQMGSSMSSLQSKAPEFVVQSMQDLAPLSRVQMVKGTLTDGQIDETVITLLDEPEGYSEACQTWIDPNFDPEEPAYWYVRIEEVPTPRWSKLVCEDMENCDQYPGADRLIRERAWSSPIWYLPTISDETLKE